MHERKHTNDLGRYNDAIIEHIWDADSIRVFAPDEAKGEFAKCLKSINPSQRIVNIETMDKFTDPQIVDKARQHFPGWYLLRGKE